MVTEAVDWPNWLVAYRVYVVVAVGVTCTCVPRVAPIWGVMIT